MRRRSFIQLACGLFVPQDVRARTYVFAPPGGWPTASDDYVTLDISERGPTGMQLELHRVLWYRAMERYLRAGIGSADDWLDLSWQARAARVAAEDPAVALKVDSTRRSILLGESREEIVDG